MIWLRSFIFNSAFLVTTAFNSILMLWVLLLPQRYVHWVALFWLRQIDWAERNVCGITYDVIGRENMPPGVCIVAAKHQSAWETFKVPLLFDRPAIVLKKELLHVPIWGWFLWRSGVIPIDRSRASTALTSMIKTARDMVADGRMIVIFPQGTRVATGVSKPYKKGVAILYEGLNLPVVPMALDSGRLWPKNSFLKKPGHITIEFLPPIPAGLPREDMMKRLESALEAATERLTRADEARDAASRP